MAKNDGLKAARESQFDPWPEIVLKASYPHGLESPMMVATPRRILRGTNPYGVKATEPGGTIADRCGFPRNLCVLGDSQFLGDDRSAAVCHAESLKIANGVAANPRICVRIRTEKSPKPSTWGDSLGPSRTGMRPSAGRIPCPNSFALCKF